MEHLLEACRDMKNYGYYHNDIKTKNILIDSSKISLIDFGLMISSPELFDSSRQNTVSDSMHWSHVPEHFLRKKNNFIYWSTYGSPQKMKIYLGYRWKMLAGSYQYMYAWQSNGNVTMYPRKGGGDIHPHTYFTKNMNKFIHHVVQGLKPYLWPNLKGGINNKMKDGSFTHNLIPRYEAFLKKSIESTDLYNMATTMNAIVTCFYKSNMLTKKEQQRIYTVLFPAFHLELTSRDVNVNNIFTQYKRVIHDITKLTDTTTYSCPLIPSFVYDYTNLENKETNANKNFLKSLTRDESYNNDNNNMGKKNYQKKSIHQLTKKANNQLIKSRKKLNNTLKETETFFKTLFRPSSSMRGGGHRRSRIHYHNRTQKKKNRVKGG